MTDDSQTSRPTSFPGEPQQPPPGLTTEMRTKPDHGEESYVGKGLLKDKAVLITGGDSGIGRAVAIAYAREGADVALSYLDEEQIDAEETRTWIEKAGRRCLLLPGDIRDREHCSRLVERTVAEFGGLDILVNNAAAQTINEGLDTIDDDEMQDAFTANVFAMIRLAKAAAPHMKPGSSIINTTSEQAKVANKTMIVYAATKGAISSLTVGLSNLLSSDGIRVNAVAPGPIWTPIQPIAKSAQELETLGQDTPVGRAGQPGELAPGLCVARLI
ncbi:SDR family oxidoreductase [Sphingomonas sp. GM_Shp_1]|uniref:SDR family oxidoreductase n=1 Tax=Sphingomonas sp. GM_Shp_1 TaxID=2937381 RepID=UPI0031F90237